MRKKRGLTANAKKDRAEDGDFQPRNTRNTRKKTGISTAMHADEDERGGKIQNSKFQGKSKVQTPGRRGWAFVVRSRRGKRRGENPMIKSQNPRKIQIPKFKGPARPSWASEAALIVKPWLPFPLTPSFAEASAFAPAVVETLAGRKATADRTAGRPALSLRERMPRIFYSQCAHEPRRRDDVPHGWSLFPLTPALSLGERENRRQLQRYPIISAAGRFTVQEGALAADLRQYADLGMRLCAGKNSALLCRDAATGAASQGAAAGPDGHESGRTGRRSLCRWSWRPASTRR